MSPNKSSQSNKTFSAKKYSRISQQNNFNYQSLFLWVNFLWSLITLGMVSQRMAVQAQGLPATLNLASLMASQGMLIEGAVAGDFTGWSVSGVGDVNGDNINDLLLGALDASPLGRSYAGAAYLIYGSKTLPAVLDLNVTLIASQGMVIQGAAMDNYAGGSVSSAGDANGDGINDLIVRAEYGFTYLIYGSKTLPAVLDLNTLNVTQGMIIQGAGSADVDGVGVSVSKAGDVNGDNISDFFVGAGSASPLNRTQAGAAYLIYGSKTLPAVLDVTLLNATQGMIIQGAGAGDKAGRSVASVGDVNGDGISDLVVGAANASPLNRTHAGTVYLIYGSNTLPAVLDLNTLVKNQGMVIEGAAMDDYSGSSLSVAGDVNGDGICDLLIGAYNASPLNRSYAGITYLIYGSKTLPAVLDLNYLTENEGMQIYGINGYNNVGRSVSGAGDINDDGINDFITGAPANTGAAYLIYGSKMLPAVLDLKNLTVIQGMVIQGASPGQFTGYSLSSAGDVNDDNMSDLVIGAYLSSYLNRTAAGAAYIIYGKAASNTIQVATSTLPKVATTTFTGTTSMNSLVMTAVNGTTTSNQSGTTKNSSSSAVTETQTQDTKADTSSGNTGTVIGAAVGASVFGLAACLGAVGFYAYRKKSKATKAELNKTDVALQDKNNVSEQENRIVSLQSDYGKIDEMKNTEKEYDHPTKLEI
jgi:hypothetical protein